jgi:hypothetical protein
MKKALLITGGLVLIINTVALVVFTKTMANSHDPKNTVGQSWIDSNITTYRYCVPKTEPGKERDAQQKQIYNDALAMQHYEGPQDSDYYKTLKNKYFSDVEKYDTCGNQNV